MSDNRNRRICKIKIGKDDMGRETVTVKFQEPDQKGGFTDFAKA